MGIAVRSMAVRMQRGQQANMAMQSALRERIRTAAYVALPGNLVDNMTSMTMAAWVNSSNTSD